MPTSQDIQRAIARNLHRFRVRRRMSLEDLATRSSVSRAMIVQIEQARTNPSINTLCLLADALGESLPSLVYVEDTVPVRVITPAETVELWRGKRGSRAHVLAGTGSTGHVELWEWHLKLGDAYDAPAHPSGTREMLFVIDGALVVTVGEDEYRAEAGDTLFFHADAPHRYAAADRAGAHLVMVVLERNAAPPARPAGAEKPRPSAQHRPHARDDARSGPRTGRERPDPRRERGSAR